MTRSSQGKSSLIFTDSKDVNRCFFVSICSFFEKISTGSNTDSDLRVVRFDGGIAKEREMIDPAEGFEEDNLPKFKKPALSKN